MISEAIKYQYRAWRYRHIVDPGEIEYIRKNLSKGQVAVDIGAHKGGYLYWLHNSVKSSGKVFAFEPQPNLYRELINVKKFYNYQGVTLENCGVSDKDGTAEFHIPVAKSSSPSARIEMLEGEFITVTIDVVTLDTYFLSREIYPDFIKIDVEGHEMKVLKGGTKLLEEARPRILMECETRHLGDQNIFEVFKFITDLDFSAYFFQDRELKPISEFDPNVHQVYDEMQGNRNYVNNFVFEPLL